MLHQETAAAKSTERHLRMDQRIDVVTGAVTFHAPIRRLKKVRGTSCSARFFAELDPKAWQPRHH
jgi:hypothetical protein